MLFDTTSLIKHFTQNAHSAPVVEVTVDDVPLKFHRITIQLPINSFAFSHLENLALFPKFYWNHSRKEAYLGSLFHTESFPTISGNGDVCLFGVHGFPDHVQTFPWDGLPTTYFFIPKIEVCCYNDHLSVTMNIVHPTKAEIAKTLSSTYKNTYASSQMVQMQCFPDSDTWEEMLASAKEAFSQNKLQKVVLARCKQMDFFSALDPFWVLQEIENIACNSTTFSLQWDRETTFLGATPECIYRRNQQHVYAAAVAGTQPLNQPFEKKEFLEFSFVSSALKDTFHQLCTSYQTSPLTTHQTHNVSHLFQSFQGELKSGIQDKVLIENLYPNPALSGDKKRTAIDLIHALEPFKRGWYTAPIGFFSVEKALFYAALRCALIRKNHVFLFAGAGIIDSSLPKSEWEELNHKADLYSFLNQQKAGHGHSF